MDIARQDLRRRRARAEKERGAERAGDGKFSHICRISETRSVRGSAGWKCLSAIPAAGSP